MPPRWPRGRTSRRRWRAEPHDLEQHLVDDEHEGARHVETVREEGAVAGIRLLLLADAARGQEGVVGLAREQVAAARAAVPQEPVARVPPLELGAVVGVRADHQLHALLLDPAERGNVLVRAEQDPRLARARLRGEVGLPFDEVMGVGGQPARQHGRVAVAHRPLQHGLREPVDLEEEDAGDVGDLAVARPPRDPVDDAERVGVVVVRPDDHLQDRRDRRDDERGEEGPPEVVDLEAAFDAADGLEGEGVRDEDEHEGRGRRCTAGAARRSAAARRH